jgi:predicted short-subunit dehydrogenase-like oxidoreductase (DUF2520 family)
MDIVLIGSGNVASTLGHLSLHAGHTIRQVYSRNTNHAEKLAGELRAAAAISIDSIQREVDLTIIAISDQALLSFVQSYGESKSLTVHTAGSLSIQNLKSVGAKHGVLYPLQSLRKEIQEFPELTFLIDGSSESSLHTIETFAKTISKNVIQADDENRMKYHLAAILVNNFTNYLYTLAADFCANENISFSVLQPLIEETVSRIRINHPSTAQTGPALRNDLITMEKHLSLTSGYPEIRQLYEIFSAQINKYYCGIKK